jgi:hypothetical protein
VTAHWDPIFTLGKKIERIVFVMAEPPTKRAKLDDPNESEVAAPLDVRPPPNASTTKKVPSILPARKILYFQGACASTDRADLQALCAHYGEVAFVDFRFGETSGYVRFRTPEGAKAASAALAGANIEVGGKTPTWRLLEGEETRAYQHAYQAKSGKGVTAEAAASSSTGGADSSSAPRDDRRAPAEPRTSEQGIVLRFEGANVRGAPAPGFSSLARALVALLPLVVPPS